MTYTPEQIEALLSAASPFPWTHRIDELNPDHRLILSGRAHPVDVASVRPWMGGLGMANAEFIAAAPEIVRQQADRIKELEAERGITQALKRVSRIANLENENTRLKQALVRHKRRVIKWE